jgi:sirohydrochlorin cobaltochelatase
MPSRLLLAIDYAMPPDAFAACRELCATVATSLGEPVYLASLDASGMDEVGLLAFDKAGVGIEQVMPKVAPSAAPMSAAPFVYREDGTPDWAAMWTTFCELALYGGPPHRGPDNPVFVSEADGVALAELDSEMVAEIRRGIKETTGLEAEPADPGWLSIQCDSKRMAAWMCAAIILENVDARCDGDVLYVPASGAFELKNQVKSVITVVAKVHHYWQAHLDAATTK